LVWAWLAISSDGAASEALCEMPLVCWRMNGGSASVFWYQEMMSKLVSNQSACRHRGHCGSGVEVEQLVRNEELHSWVESHSA
jgi:hypothetical protein